MVKVIRIKELKHSGLLKAGIIDLKSIQMKFLMKFSSLSFTMVERTFETFEAFKLVARLSLIEIRMELLFLPAVTQFAFRKVFATFVISSDKVPALPFFTELS